MRVVGILLMRVAGILLATIGGGFVTVAFAVPGVTEAVAVEAGGRGREGLEQPGAVPIANVTRKRPITL
jgi:hypothetical protein